MKYFKSISLIFAIYGYLTFSCSSDVNKYEYIQKNQSFFENFDLDSNSNFIKLSSGYTYYKSVNKNSNTTPIVLIHGFSVPSYIWDNTFNMLSEKGYYVISLDLYGRGFSENPVVDYTDELFANQVLELLKKLQIESAVFVGLSNGGRVISKLTDINSSIVEKLIYVASSSFIFVDEIEDKSVSNKEIKNFIQEFYSTISISQMNDFKYPENHFGWDKKYDELLKYKGFARALISTRKNHFNMDKIHTKIQNSNIPVFTIWGESDEVIVYEDFASRIDSILPRRQQFFISESGHLPHMENPYEFNKLILEIINN